jgi:hypothetical protein
MSDVIEALREGDIYRWSYADPNTNNGQWGDYHCCSRIAIVNRGRLRDTYWQIGASFSEGRSFGPDDLPRLQLTRLGNLADLQPAKEYEADYYADADIVNLNHPNSTRGNFYLRKGAVRCQKKMLEAARHKLESSESDRKSAEWRSEQFHASIARIEAGDLNGHI